MSLPVNSQAYMAFNPVSVSKPKPRFGGAVRIPRSVYDEFERRMLLLANNSEATVRQMHERLEDTQPLVNGMAATIATKTGKLGEQHAAVTGNVDVIVCRTPQGISLWLPEEGLALARQMGDFKIPKTVVQVGDTYSGSSQDWLNDLSQGRVYLQDVWETPDGDGLLLGGNHHESLVASASDKLSVESITQELPPVSEKAEAEMAYDIAYRRNPFDPSSREKPC